MKITKRWLKSQGACPEGIDFVESKGILNLEHKEFIQRLQEYDHWDYTRWLMPRLLTHKQQVQFAVYCAKLVLPIFEQKYPQDKRPRKAIQAAQKWIKQPTEENAAAARAAAYAADAADAARAAADAAYAADAADAARAAADAAYAARDAAYAAYAAYAASDAAADEREKTIDKIIKYFNKIMEQK